MYTPAYKVATNGLPIGCQKWLKTTKIQPTLGSPLVATTLYKKLPQTGPLVVDFYHFTTTLQPIYNPIENQVPDYSQYTTKEMKPSQLVLLTIF